MTVLYFMYSNWVGEGGRRPHPPLRGPRRHRSS